MDMFRKKERGNVSMKSRYDKEKMIVIIIIIIIIIIIKG